MKSVAYHADLALTQGGDELCALLDAPRRAAPFERLGWWRALAGECGLSPVLAVCRDDETGGTAVLPLARGPIRAICNRSPTGTASPSPRW